MRVEIYWGLFKVVVSENLKVENNEVQVIGEIFSTSENFKPFESVSLSLTSL